MTVSFGLSIMTTKTSVNKTLTVMTVLTVLTLTLTSVTAQLISRGICPNPPPMPNLNVTKYAGRWYDTEKYWFAVQATTACTTVDYLPNFDVDIRQIETLTKTVVRLTGHTTFVDKNSTTADLVLELFLTHRPVPVSVHFPYRVLMTDYSTYTIKYSCIQVGSLRFEGMWILSQGRKNVYGKTRAKVHRIIDSLGLQSSALTPSSNLLGHNCPW